MASFEDVSASVCRSHSPTNSLVLRHDGPAAASLVSRMARSTSETGSPGDDRQHRGHHQVAHLTSAIHPFTRAFPISPGETSGLWRGELEVANLDRRRARPPKNRFRSRYRRYRRRPRRCGGSSTAVLRRTGRFFTPCAAAVFDSRMSRRVSCPSARFPSAHGRSL